MRRKLSAVIALALVLSLSVFTVYAASNNVASAYKTGVSGTSSADTDNDYIEVTDTTENAKSVAAEALASSAGSGLPSNGKAVDAVDIHWHSGKTDLDSDLTVTLKGTNVKSGDEVYVLHKLSGSGSWVKYSGTNKGGGTVEFTVPAADGLSPFVVVAVPTSTSTTPTSPSTGDVSRFVALAALTCAVAAAGVFVSSFKKEEN